MIFSVVIPTRNRPGSLETCLNAVSRQLRGSCKTEVIVVDDGSRCRERARNRELCDSYGFTLMVRDPCSGPAPARNAGWRSSTGLWVAFLDDDVCVEDGWFAALREATAKVSPDVLALEGRTIARGAGVWDREVQSMNGGLYLTTNIVYRRRALEQLDGFDEAIPGPFCEDQELAVRALRQGDIRFVDNLTVSHQPRRVGLCAPIVRAPNRIRLLLMSELYFWVKHPHDYGKFRYADTFWGTYRGVACKQVWVSLKRRRVRQIVDHPVGALSVIAGAAVEQVSAVALGPALRRLEREYRIMFSGETKGL